MVTNLTEEAKARWAEATATKNPVRKLQLLREFFSLMPHHKGTSKLEVSLKRQIASLEEEIERTKSRRAGSTRLEWVVKKESIPQIAVVGSLKTSSSFFNTITCLNTEPFDALLSPVIGIFRSGSLRFQIVLTPFDRTIGEEKQERLMSIVRNADGLLVVLGYESFEYLQDVVEWFEGHNIDIRSERLAVEIILADTGGIRVVGSSEKMSERDLVDLLLSYGVRNAVVKVSHNAVLDDVEAAIFGRIVKKTIYVGLSNTACSEMRRIISDSILFDPETDRKNFSSFILDTLGLIRIYTKKVGAEPMEEPLLVKKGTQIIDVAREVHRDLKDYFRYARLWRNSNKKGVKVGRSFEVEDGDIVEIHSL